MELKKPTTYKEQLMLFKQRGCIVEDDNFALKTLENVNYYRLTAYFLPFKKADDNYIQGTSFTNVIDIYEFDRRLRILLLSLLEGLETRLRIQIAYLHAHKYGEWGYMDSKNFRSPHDHMKFVKHIEDIIKSNDQSLIVRHHNKKYDGKFPIWVIIELFTFGMLSIFYSDMKRADQKEIAKSLFNRSDAELRSWLYCLTSLRNACAHYSRLYYTLFPGQPAHMQGVDRAMDKRLFDYILMIRALCKGTAYWDTEFLPAFLALMEKHDNICLEHIGFPENWRDYLTI